MKSKDKPTSVKAESIGEMLFKISRMNKKPGSVFIPDVETAEKIAQQLQRDIAESLAELREQQRKQIEASRLTFIELNTPMDI